MPHRSRSPPPEKLSDHVEALIKEARAQEKMLREDAEMEARVTAEVVVRPFGDADELLLVGGHMYRLRKPDQISVRLNMEHSGSRTLNNQRFGSKFVEEVANLSDSELRWLKQFCILYISGK